MPVNIAPKYLILSEDYDLFYTNDKDKALKAAEVFRVYNLETKKLIDNGENVIKDMHGKDVEIKEWME